MKTFPLSDLDGRPEDLLVAARSGPVSLVDRDGIRLVIMSGEQYDALVTSAGAAVAYTIESATDADLEILESAFGELAGKVSSKA